MIALVLRIVGWWLFFSGAFIGFILILFVIAMLLGDTFGLKGLFFFVAGVCGLLGALEHVLGEKKKP